MEMFFKKARKSLTFGIFSNYGYSSSNGERIPVAGNRIQNEPFPVHYHHRGNTGIHFLEILDKKFGNRPINPGIDNHRKITVSGKILSNAEQGLSGSNFLPEGHVDFGHQSGLRRFMNDA